MSNELTPNDNLLLDVNHNNDIDTTPKAIGKKLLSYSIYIMALLLFVGIGGQVGSQTLQLFIR